MEKSIIDPQTKRLLRIVIVVAVLAAIVSVLVAAIGAEDVTVGRIIALFLGVFATVLLAGGLMAAMFYSDRAGYDR